MGTERAGKRRWSDLSSRRRGGVLIGSFIQFALLAVALRDLWRRPSEQVNGSKVVWTLACFVNFVGPLAYLRFGRRVGPA